MNYSVISKDGTCIAYQVTGEGPALILVPGALALASDFVGLAGELAVHFTIYTMERRGRGASGPQGDDYRIERECEDLLALQAKTSAKYLFGHSFGGFLALETARGNHTFTKIAVYEPGVSIDGSINTGWIPRCQQEIHRRHYHDAFTTFVQGLDPNSAKLPHWLLKQVLRLVIKKSELEQKYPLLEGTIREHQEEVRLNNTYPHYGEVSANVLCLFGGKSGKVASDTATKLASVIPQAEITVCPGLNHLSPEDKPAPVASPLISFFIPERSGYG